MSRRPVSEDSQSDDAKRQRIVDAAWQAEQAFEPVASTDPKATYIVNQFLDNGGHDSGNGESNLSSKTSPEKPPDKDTPALAPHPPGRSSPTTQALTSAAPRPQERKMSASKPTSVVAS